MFIIYAVFVNYVTCEYNYNLSINTHVVIHSLQDNNSKPRQLWPKHGSQSRATHQSDVPIPKVGCERMTTVLCCKYVYILFSFSFQSQGLGYIIIIIIIISLRDLFGFEFTMWSLWN